MICQSRYQGLFVFHEKSELVLLRYAQRTQNNESSIDVSRYVKQLKSWIESTHHFEIDQLDNMALHMSSELRLMNLFELGHSSWGESHPYLSF